MSETRGKARLRAAWIRVVLVALLSGLCLPSAAHAIRDCEDARAPVPGASEGDRVYKLLLDEFSLPTSFSDVDILHQALHHKLQDNFDKALLDLGRFHVVLCLGRRPESVNDLTGYVDGFVDGGVALETWGVFDGDEAMLTYAMVPLMSERAEAWRPGVSYVLTSYEYDGSGELRFLKRVVGESLDARVFAAIGAASAAHMEADYDTARYYFCRALLMIEQFGSGGLGANPRAGELTRFVREMSLKVIEDAIRARDAGAYSGDLGSLEIPVGMTCYGDLS